MKSVSLYHPVRVVDQLLDSFFESPFVPFTGNGVMNKLPLVDVQETADSYLVEAELPGFDEKQIKVHVEGGKLSIESQKDEEKKEEKDGSYLLRERRKVSFSRSFTLPENADTESVAAVFKNGVLSLEIKKRAENARRLIEINAE
jgi:HSP20 family molecular chaperone IbpA